MSEEFGPVFISVTDEDGNEHTLEYVVSVEYQGVEYRAFFPAEEEGAEENPDDGLILLKVIEENGEELLSTCDSEAEEEAVYDLVMEALFEEEDEEP